MPTVLKKVAELPWDRNGSQEQLIKEEKKKKQYDVDMVSERYGMAPIKYEKPQSNENKLLGLLVVLGILLILVILVLVMVLN